MKSHQPRPWRCTARTAIYCPHHHDCSCKLTPDRQIPASPSPDCPLHGLRSDHGLAEPRLIA